MLGEIAAYKSTDGTCSNDDGFDVYTLFSRLPDIKGKNRPQGLYLNYATRKKFSLLHTLYASSGDTRNRKSVHEKYAGAGTGCSKKPVKERVCPVQKFLSNSDWHIEYKVLAQFKHNPLQWEDALPGNV